MLALQLLNLNGHRDLTAPVAELLLSRLNDAAYQWNDLDKTTINLIFRETDLSPHEFEFRLLLGGRAPGVWGNDPQKFIGFLNRINAADIDRFFLRNADFLKDNVLYGYTELKDTLSALSDDRRSAVMRGLGPRVSRTLQAKEGRRPRPVVPGSLRAGCFSAGKI